MNKKVAYINPESCVFGAIITTQILSKATSEFRIKLVSIQSIEVLEI